MSIPFCIVTAWHNEDQKHKFLKAWNIVDDYNADPLYPQDWLVLQQDKNKEGCAVTKNKGIAAARERDPEVIVILDDDCLPLRPYSSSYTDLPYSAMGIASLEQFAQAHIEALEPQEVELFEAVTDPPSRGTPYFYRTVKMPVAASMGFWSEHPDYDASTELCQRKEPWNPTPIKYHRKTMFWRFFPLSGMNLAWNDKEWGDFAVFHHVPRFDDIWMGLPWEREAYNRGYCFNLNGPMVRHVRQSNVWANLKIEAQYMEENEIRWKDYTDFR